MIMLQFITHATSRYTHLQEVAMALKGGCRWIQLRMKDATDEEVVTVGREAVSLCHASGAMLILDDRVELCQRIGADGVHLGRHDMPLDKARQLLGKEAIIGATVNTDEDLLRAAKAHADYIGCGPFRFTTTKSHLAPVLGLDGYRHIIQTRRETGITTPIVAIGGITRADIPALMATGVDGIALSGCVVRADDPTEEMKRICQTVCQTIFQRP